MRTPGSSSSPGNCPLEDDGDDCGGGSDACVRFTDTDGVDTKFHLPDVGRGASGEGAEAEVPTPTTDPLFARVLHLAAVTASKRSRPTEIQARIPCTMSLLKPLTCVDQGRSLRTICGKGDSPLDPGEYGLSDSSAIASSFFTSSASPSTETLESATHVSTTLVPPIVQVPKTPSYLQLHHSPAVANCPCKTFRASFSANEEERCNISDEACFHDTKEIELLLPTGTAIVEKTASTFISDDPLSA
ncbi:uncharacterized protein Tco025E_03263 [Trypanosoma conorhini]|uniref:Uncharacterized protein n=1 Tax=Trypanosoma conorhini TaxID=83891 RepID=A0A3R7MXY3_9TRYP|nr:uncharacterized protein Tco025E_03263 [Trypanosoma conorhini]RNF22373.1 hypothetical protein Tco025E_03263 [Trypanosoma conorhini]